MLAAMEVTRTVCGIEFAPDWDAFARGAWHTCPRCRCEPDRKASEDLEADSGRIHGHTVRQCEREGAPCAE